jgi:hypothetical protein
MKIMHDSFPRVVHNEWQAFQVPHDPPNGTRSEGTLRISACPEPLQALGHNHDHKNFAYTQECLTL